MCREQRSSSWHVYKMMTVLALVDLFHMRHRAHAVMVPVVVPSMCSKTIDHDDIAVVRSIVMRVWCTRVQLEVTILMTTHA